MIGTRAKVVGFLLLATSMAVVLSAGTPEQPVLRVCADPDDLPFSNEQQEGFENKIAQLIAAELGDSLVNVWWPHRRGFVRNTLRGGLCDLIIGVPKGFDPVLTTKPYYRSTYYFVYRQSRNLGIRSLDDTVLRHLKIGVNLIGYDYTNTPPAHALSARGVVGNLVGFHTFYTQSADRPNDIIDAVANGTVDVAIVWGPLAGYYAKRAPVPLTLVALPDSDAASGMPFAFDIAMAVRRSDKGFGARIDSLLERRHDEILAILLAYNVPMSVAARGPRDAQHDGTRTVSAPAVASQAQDTTRDNLLVTDDEYQGWKWFHVYCYRCHGVDAFGGQLAPDLRNSLSAQGGLTRDTFMVTVRDGRPTKGMPPWNVLLNEKQIEQLYAYVKARSDGRLAPGRPHRATEQ
jgi:quinoprotein dehydrogenase-associated probable ABC transporter substrate-binding protein